MECAVNDRGRESVWINSDLAAALRELKALTCAESVGELLDRYAARAIYRELRRARESRREYGGES